MSQEETKINISQILQFFKAYGWIILLVIPIFLSIWLRATPAYLPITDDWAENSMNNAIKMQIEEQITSQYPNLPAQNKQSMIDSEFVKAKEQMGDQFDQQIKDMSAQYKKSFQDETGQTYLLAIDPYYYLRQTENYIETGHVGDEIKDGKDWDNHMLAPTGASATKSFHVLFSAFTYKIMHLFDSKTTPMKAAFFVPLIIAMLAVIPAFFIGKKVAGNGGGFFAGLITAIHPNFLTRTVAGFSDTDAYNVFFPLMIVWTFIEGLTAKDAKWKYAWMTTSGFLVALFAYTWSAWWFIFDALVGGIVIYLIYLISRNKKEFGILLAILTGSALLILTTGNLLFLGLIIAVLVAYALMIYVTKHKLEDDTKSFLKTSGVFLLSSYVFISLFKKSLTAISAMIKTPLVFLGMDSASNISLWPNVFTTVAELNNASLTQIISQMGGKVLMLCAVIGIIWVLLKKEKDTRSVSIILALWFFGTLFMSLKGIRFTLLLVPAFAVGVGICFGLLIKQIPPLGKKIGVGKGIIQTLLIIICVALIMLVPMSQGGKSMYGMSKITSINEVPSYTDAWHNSLEKIQQESSEDAIVNSWWDFGHWFKYGTDRAVTFDGGTQNTPMAHWIGKVLATENETKAKGILRMLDCGSRNGVDAINEKLNDLKTSVELTNKIIVLEKEDAKTILLDNGFSEAESENILMLTHCIPPEDYFITSTDMVGKAGVWGHFGLWNFERAKIWQQSKDLEYSKITQMLEIEFNYTKDNANEVTKQLDSFDEKEANNWISGWPGYYSTGNCVKTNNTFECTNNIQGQILQTVIDIEEETMSANGQIVNPKNLAFVKNGEFKKIEFEDNKLPYGIAIVPMNGAYTSLVLDPALTGSMFTRLFYYNGLGLKHFDKFNYQTTITGQKIITWKVNWDGIEEVKINETENVS